MKDRLSQLLEKWGERFEAFSLRERALISIAMVVVMFLLWDALLMSQEGLRQKQMVAEMHSINEKVAAVNGQIRDMTAALRGGEAQQVTARVQEIRTLLASLEQQQADLTVEFIRPSQMAGVLRDMLKAENGLVLTKLESLGASPLFPPSKDAAEKETRSEHPGIFKHGMRIEFEGDYFKTLHYLKSLEAMPWRLYWDNVEYQVLDYPRARIAITVHTLSLDEGWIGV
jgi:MSHA biogenesis protein MshJ